MTIIEIGALGVGGISTIVILFTNIGKLRGYYSKFIDWKRARFAKKQQPYCSKICQASICMTEILSTLKEIKHENSITREISLRTLGDRLKQKANHFCDKGFMPQSDKDEMIEEFITYHIGGGNGAVLYKVGLAMNLPTKEGGNTCDVDMSGIIEREREKYIKKHG